MIETPKMFPGRSNYFEQLNTETHIISSFLACICQEAKTLADKQHKRAKAKHLVPARPFLEVAGSTEPAATASPAPSPSGASLPCCGSPTIPSQTGARRNCRSCVLDLVRKLWPFVC